MSERLPLTPQKRLGQTARSAARRRHPPSISVSELSVTFLHNVCTHNTRLYVCTTEEEEGAAVSAVLKAAVPHWFNLLLVSDDSCMKTCWGEQLAESAGAKPPHPPAPVPAGSTPLPNEGIYSAAPRHRGGQRASNLASLSAAN